MPEKGCQNVSVYTQKIRPKKYLKISFDIKVATICLQKH